MKYLSISLPGTAWHGWHKGSNNLSVSRPVVDEEMMRPLYWLGSVLHVSFSAFTLMVG